MFGYSAYRPQKGGVIVSGHKIFFPLELKKISCNEQPWLGWYWMQDHWFFLLLLLICVTDIALGCVFVNLFVHRGPVKGFLCLSVTRVLVKREIPVISLAIHINVTGVLE